MLNKNKIKGIGERKGNVSPLVQMLEKNIFGKRKGAIELMEYIFMTLIIVIIIIVLIFFLSG